MAVEKTLSIIKPDAVKRKLIGEIYSRFEQQGLSIIGAKMLHLSRLEAEKFYAIHQEKAFFNHLIDYMISGPIMVQVLEGEGAITKNRTLMGNVDPKKADLHTIRADFGQSITINSVHGSDSPVNAMIEINHFFKPNELHSAWVSQR